MVPVNDATGAFRAVVVIFKGKKVQESWVQGVDVFMELDKDNALNNYGPGKRFPGMVLHDADGVEIPVLFAASPKASMTSTILKEMLKMMDEKKITERGDEYENEGESEEEDEDDED